MEFLAPYHPAIVHAPIALIVISVLFDLVGRATDLAWWRRAAYAMLILGVMGAAFSVLSGRAAAEIAANHQGVPQEPIGEHAQVAYLTLWVGLAAVIARALAPRLGGARAAVSGLALLLHLAAAVLVMSTGYRGGELVFDHGAGVKLHGELLRSGPPRPPGIKETAQRRDSVSASNQTR